MYKAKIENTNGNVMILTGKEAVYQIISIIGLNPPNAQINTSTIVGLDGAVYNSAKLETRNIVITVKINGDVERNRLELYQYFRTKEWCRFYYTNESRNVYIDGYVESVECDLFSNDEQAQISIICPYPYFSDLTEIVDDISNVVSLFTFPFSINEPIPFSNLRSDDVTNVFNTSESEVGVKIVIFFEDSVNTVLIQNIDTGEHITLSYSFQTGDVVTINTYKGQKSIKLQRNGTITNIFSSLQTGSTFFQLHAGSNLFDYLADYGESDDDVTVRFYHNNAYRGV